MANYRIWALGKSAISVSGGGQLDGITQGDGSHLVGLSITLDSNDFEDIRVRDRPNADVDFDDNDDDQVVRGRVNFDGARYDNNTRIEAEYLLTLRDESTGTEYTAVAVNINNSSPTYATVEGLAFVVTFPPIGRPLQVIAASEGPGDFGIPPIAADDLAVPCFASGTIIDTDLGPRPVESLLFGDRVKTVDSGFQEIRWIGCRALDADTLSAHPHLRPVRFTRGAMGRDLPWTDLVVSPQHRIRVNDWRAELLFGQPDVLLPAKAFLGLPGVEVLHEWTGSYFHLLCDRHELLWSNGLVTESLHPGEMALSALDPEDVAAISARLGAASPKTSRPAIRVAEALAITRLGTRAA